MQYMLDSDPVGTVLVGAHVRPAEELVTALRKGSYLRKYGRRGKPKNHYFRLSADDKELLWDSSNGKVRSIPLVSVVKVQQGQTTEVFSRDPLPEFESLSFSMIYTEGRAGKKRSLDVVCRNMAEFETWYWGIQLVIAWTQDLAMQQLQQQQFAAQQPVSLSGAAETPAASSVELLRTKSTPSSPHMSNDKLQEFRQIAAALQPPKAVTGAAVLSSAPTQARLAGAGVLGTPPPPKREIGDCYIWGDWADAEALAAVAAGDCTLQSCCVPIMVANTHVLDVIQVAVGARHAALLTRGGEVYTWGSGQGGKLGNGTNLGSPFPHQVARLAGQGTVAVACGRCYTAAILPDGGLCTWGSGLGGQLGLGPSVLSSVWPTRVAALDGIRVEQVSCGPFHAAAISDDGRLFTWGDGLFGKLGHGDHETCCSPRQVEDLAEHWVISASCGWWHSAAVAVSRGSMMSRDASTTSIGASSTSTGTSSQPSSRHNLFARAAAPTATNGVFINRSVAASRASSNGSIGLMSRGASGAFPDVGGGLFTWGGDFTWQQRGKRDHHEGCLGLGDLAGRLVPTMVKGEDDIKQVACGLNFTVALTRNGEVLQMGRTGAENNREHNAMWEGARVPVLVSGLLSSHYADALACGMSHIAVVATQRKANGGASGAAAASNNMTRLLTWGQGSRGQLGIGNSREDHLLPQLVSSVAGRRILYLACGGHYTLAVCQHDPRTARWSRETLELDVGSSTASTAAAALITGSGPSRMALQTLRSMETAGGMTGSASDRGAGSAMGAGSKGAAPGLGGMVLSASYNSLASSTQSSSRGEGSGIGSGGGIGSSISNSLRGVRSERRLEARHSDKGFLMSHSSKGNVLTRSVDRSCPGGSGGGGSVPLATQSLGFGLGGGDVRGVSFSPTPRTVVGGGRSSDRGAMDPSMMSLVSLAKSTKKSRLAITKSFKSSSFKNALAGSGIPRNDSNNSSSSSRQGWGDSSHKQGQQVVQLPGRSSFRQVSYSSYSARSEQDLMTLSTNSSISSMTPSPSMHSIHDSRGGCAGEAAEGLGTSPAVAAGEDIAKQLRYWQERAANMEQQLSRKTHELEQLRRDMQHGSSKLLVQSLQQQQQQQQDSEQQEAASASAVQSSSSALGSKPEPATAAAAAHLQQQQQLLRGAEPPRECTAPNSSKNGAPLAAAAANLAGQAEGKQQQEVTPITGACAAASDAASCDGGSVASRKSDDSNGLFRPASLVSWIKGGKPDSSSSSTAAAVEHSAKHGQSPPHLKFKGRSMSSGESFAFKSLHPEAPTGLQALRGVMSGSGDKQRSLQRGVSLPTGSHVQAQQHQQQQRSSLGNAMSNSSSTIARRDETLKVVLQQDAFAEMGTHSSEASRVLALFQQSQRQRQEQEEQHQEQPRQQQIRTAAAAAAAQPGRSLASGGSSTAGYHSPLSTTPHTSPAAQGASVSIHTSNGRQLPSALGTGTGEENGGSPHSPGVALCMASPSDSRAAATAATESELEILRQQNKLLQQQLAELQLLNQQPPQQVAQQPQQQLPALSAGQDSLLLHRSSNLVGSITTSNGNSVGGAPSTGAALNLAGLQQRRASSVEICSCEVVTHEVSPGVYLSMQALPTGGCELRRVRFAKQMFSSEDAEQWWTANRTAIYASYNIVAQQPSMSQQQQQPLVAVAGVASAGVPLEQHQQQEHQQPGGTGSDAASLSTAVAGAASSGGTVSAPVVVSVLNPHPLGQPAAPTTNRGPSLTGLRTKWASTGDWTPPTNSPSLSSPGNASTYDLDPFSASAAGSAADPDASLSRLGRSVSVSAVVAAIESGAPLPSPCLQHEVGHNATDCPGRVATSYVQGSQAEGHIFSNDATASYMEYQQEAVEQQGVPVLHQASSHADSTNDGSGTGAATGGRRYSQGSGTSGASSSGAAVPGSHKRSASGSIFRLFSKNSTASLHSSIS